MDPGPFLAPFFGPGPLFAPGQLPRLPPFSTPLQETVMESLLRTHSKVAPNYSIIMLFLHPGRR